MTCKCCCCMRYLRYAERHHTLPCGDTYCIDCIRRRCRLGLENSSNLPADCCKREIPIDYVREALTSIEFVNYERFLNERQENWKTSTLISDQEYKSMISCNGWRQCPRCGMGVERISGCNHVVCFHGHAFCYGCGEIRCRCYYWSVTFKQILHWPLVFEMNSSNGFAYILLLKNTKSGEMKASHVRIIL